MVMMIHALSHLMEELVEEILLRLPPDDPGSLLRAALVSKSWCRLVSGPDFNRRFREFHHLKSPPPVLGFFCRIYHTSDTDSVPGDHRFMPLAPSSFHRLPHAFMPSWGAIDAHHGRILFYDDDNKEDMAATPAGSVKKLHLIVWNPITGEVSRLPVVPMTWPMSTWSTAAALLCDDDHGPFRVVLVNTQVVGLLASACVYSSEQHAWSTPIISTQRPGVRLLGGRNALVGNALYLKCHLKKKSWILEYDVSKQETSLISIPTTCRLNCIALMTAEGGGLGFAVVRNFKLYTWAREVGLDDGVGRWAQQRVFELDKLLPFSCHSLSTPCTTVLAAENTLSAVFIRTRNGFFVVDLKLGRVRTEIYEHSDGRHIYAIVPYASFCTPVVRSGLLDEGPRAG